MEKALFYAVSPCEKPIEEGQLQLATTIYLHVWNMDCKYCGIWLCNALLTLHEVLRVDAFVDRGIVAVTHCGDPRTPMGILATIQNLGAETQRFYNAEIIGMEPTATALRSQRSA